jgi:hypothetical protein
MRIALGSRAGKRIAVKFVDSQNTTKVRRGTRKGSEDPSLQRRFCSPGRPLPGLPELLFPASPFETRTKTTRKRAAAPGLLELEARRRGLHATVYAPSRRLFHSLLIQDLVRCVRR